MFRNCLVDGKRALEVASGELESWCSRDLEAASAKLMAKAREVSDADHVILLKDLRLAHGLVDSGLRVNIAHWMLILWLICGVMHHCLEQARKCAAECLRQWGARPCPQEHHRVSNLFLAAGSVFREQLACFAAGADWDSLSESVIVAILPLRCVPIAERLIEGRHADVAHKLAGHKKRGHPTKVSLSSGRLEEFGRRVALGATVLNEVAAKLEDARSFQKVAMVFQLTERPAVQPLWRGRAKPLHTHQWEVPVCEVVYRCDLYSKYADKAKLVADQHKQKHRQKREEAAAGRRAQRNLRNVNERQHVLQSAMHEHLVMECQNHGAGFLFAADLRDASNSSKVTTTEYFLGCPAEGAALRYPVSLDPNRPRILADTGASRDSDEILEPGAMVEPGQEHTVTRVWFQVLYTAASRLKLMRVGPAVGRKLCKDDIVVSVHEPLLGIGMLSKPKYLGVAARVGVLSSLDTLDPDVLETSCGAWEISCHKFVHRNVAVGAHRAEHVVTSLVMASAMPSSAGECKPMEIAHHPGHAAAIDTLWSLAETGHVRCMHEDLHMSQWYLTSEGVAMLDMACVMSYMRPMFTRPEQITLDSLDNLSRYQLIRVIETQGWTWQAMPRFVLHRRELAYRPGTDNPTRVWCAMRGQVPARVLLQCLAIADTVLREHGLEVLEHGKQDIFYRGLLARVFAGPAVLVAHRSLEADVHEDSSGEDAPPLGDLAGLGYDDDVASEALSDALEELMEREMAQALREEEETEEDTGHAAIPTPDAPMPEHPLISAATPIPGAPVPELPEHPLIKARRGPSELNHWWGAFRLTLQCSKKGSFSWQIICPYHRKHESTGCKKGLAFRFDDADGGESFKLECDRCVLALKHWGIRALESL